MKINGIIEEALGWLDDVFDTIDMLFGLPVGSALATIIFAIGAIAATIFIAKILWAIMRRARVASRRYDILIEEWKLWAGETWTTIQLKLINCKLRKMIRRRKALMRKLSGFSPHKTQRT